MDNTTILSWNVRGLNDRARRHIVRTLVDEEQVFRRISITVIQVVAVFTQHGHLWIDAGARKLGWLVRE